MLMSVSDTLQYNIFSEYLNVYGQNQYNESSGTWERGNWTATGFRLASSFMKPEVGVQKAKYSISGS